MQSFRGVSIAKSHRIAQVCLVGIVAFAALTCQTPRPSGPTPPTATMSGNSPSPSTVAPVPWLQPREEREREQRLAAVEVAPAVDRATDRVTGAVEEATSAGVGWRGELPAQPSYRALLDEDRSYEGSVSLGSSSEGHLENAASLPVRGNHYEILEKHRERGLRWGTDEMVELLTGAADDVAEAFPGSTMRVGNLGREHGGDIAWSHSHNSGRDADLAFFARRPSSGERVPTPGLVSFDADGEAAGDPDLVFDVPRNWRLVKSLLTSPKADIQWLFVSEPLKHEMLAHAREQGEPKRLVRRAKHVLHQPSDAPPHNDHLHVRITCSKQDRLEGCLDYGPRWVWADWHRRDLLARTLEIGRALDDPDPTMRRRALEFLERIRSPFAPEIALLEGVDDPNSEVRAAAWEAATEIRHWSTAAIEATITVIANPETPLGERREGYEILRRDHSRRARRFAFSRLLSEEVSVQERVFAARALRHVMEPGLVPSLIDELDRQPPPVRREIATVLRRITGHSEEVDWEELSDTKLAEATASWEKWWERARTEPRTAWLVAELGEHGLEVDASKIGDAETVDQLIPLLDQSPDHVAYNANLLIHRATERWIPLEAWSYERLHRYWRNWWHKNRRRLLDDDLGGFPDSVIAEH